MGFDKVYVTEKGLELEAKSRTGKVIKILRIEIGDGELIGNNITNQTALIHKKLDCKVNSIQEVDSQTIINFILQQNNVEEGFFFRELGVIAEDPDTQEEILYMYANASNKAEFVDDKNSTFINDKVIDIVVKANNTDNIMISIDNTIVFVDRREYLKKMLELDNKIKLKADKKKTYNITINSKNWTEEVPYMQTIEIQGILETDTVNIYPIWSADLETRQTEKEEYNQISLVKLDENEIELICDEDKPTIDLNVRIEVNY